MKNRYILLIFREQVNSWILNDFIIHFSQKSDITSEKSAVEVDPRTDELETIVDVIAKEFIKEGLKWSWTGVIKNDKFSIGLVNFIFFVYHIPDFKKIFSGR